MQNHTSHPDAPNATYQLGRRLSAGSTGDVYEATHPWLPGAFVVKVLRRALAQVPAEVTAFQSELAEISALRHPNIVRIVELGATADGLPFVVMERLSGRTLEDKTRDGRVLSTEEVVPLVNGIASGLHAAHGRGVVHRELRPSSVFLATAEAPGPPVAKLLNFGIARLRNTSGGDAGFGADHARYMAPEQAQGRAEQIDGRTDQFALAAITYRMLTGKDAFRGDDSIAVLFQVVHETPELLADSTTLPAGVATVIRKGLSKQRDDRFESAGAFAEALAEAAAGKLGVVQVPPAANGARAVTEDFTGRFEPAEPNAIPRTAGAVTRTQTGGGRMKTSRPSRSNGRAPSGMAMAGGGVLLEDSAVWRSELDAAVDEDDDDDLRVPRQRWKLGVFFLSFAVACGGAAWWAGWRPPQSWQRTELWHALRLPHIERPARTTDPLPMPSGTPSALANGSPGGGVPSGSGGPVGPRPASGVAAAAPLGSSENSSPGTGTPADGTPATTAPASGMTATGTAAAGTTAAAPAAGTPAAGTTATGAPVAGTTAAGTPATGTTATGVPAAGTTAAGTPAAGTTATGAPVAGTMAGASAVAGSTAAGISAAADTTAVGAPAAGPTAAGTPVAGTTAAGTPVAGTTAAGAVAAGSPAGTTAASPSAAGAPAAASRSKHSDRGRGRAPDNARFNGVVWSEAQQRLVPVGSPYATPQSAQPIHLERRVPVGSSDSLPTSGAAGPRPSSDATGADQSSSTAPREGRPNIQPPASMAPIPERAAPVTTAPASEAP